MRRIIDVWKSLPTWGKWVVVAGIAITVIGIGAALEGEDEDSGSSPGAQTERQTGNGEQDEAASVNKNSRAYIFDVVRCAVITDLLRADIQQERRNEIELADEAIGARDTCDTVRSELLEIETDQFDDEAAEAWSGVDRLKSGLNALLTWIDNPEPTKLIEARDKLLEGAAATRAGVRAINARRQAYGLPPVRP